MQCCHVCRLRRSAKEPTVQSTKSNVIGKSQAQMAMFAKQRFSFLRHQIVKDPGGDPKVEPYAAACEDATLSLVLGLLLFQRSSVDCQGSPVSQAFRLLEDGPNFSQLGDCVA